MTFNSNDRLPPIPAISVTAAFDPKWTLPLRPLLAQQHHPGAGRLDIKTLRHGTEVVATIALKLSPA
jgi:hypothetical protein